MPRADIKLSFPDDGAVFNIHSESSRQEVHVDIPIDPHSVEFTSSLGYLDTYYVEDYLLNHPQGSIGDLADLMVNGDIPAVKYQSSIIGSTHHILKFTIENDNGVFVDVNLGVKCWAGEAPVESTEELIRWHMNSCRVFTHGEDGSISFRRDTLNTDVYLKVGEKKMRLRVFWAGRLEKPVLKFSNKRTTQEIYTSTLPKLVEAASEIKVQPQLLRDHFVKEVLAKEDIPYKIAEAEAMDMAKEYLESAKG